MTDRNELERLQPMTTEQKALALVKKARQFCTRITIGDEIARQMADELERAIEREQAAIEAHEAYKREVSEAVELVLGSPEADFFHVLSRFIIPEADPLVEVVAEALELTHVHFSSEENASAFLKDIAARGYKIERIDNA